MVTVSVLTGCASTSSQPGDSSSSAAAGSSNPPATTASSIAEDVGPSSNVMSITSSDLPAPAPLAVAPAGGSPQRIVSLASGVGETLAALGVGSRVVGRDETSDAPGITAAPIVTKAHAVSAERVLALDPDIVIVDASTSPPEALDQIRGAGVRVVEVPEAWTLDDIGPRTQAVAAAVGLPSAAADAVAAEATSEVSTADTSTTPRVAFLYLRGTSAIYLLGGEGSGADALISAAGGVDVGAEAGLGAFTPLTAEALAAANPDIILVMTKGLESVGGVDGLTDLPGVAQTVAGRDRRVVQVDDTLLLSFGPRTGRLITRLSEAFQNAAP